MQGFFCVPFYELGNHGIMGKLFRHRHDGNLWEMVPPGA